MPQNGGGKGWVTDPETGEQVMPATWAKYLDWLLSEVREPSTSKAWAAENGFNDRTVRRWLLLCICSTLRSLRLSVGWWLMMTVLCLVCLMLSCMLSWSL